MKKEVFRWHLVFILIMVFVLVSCEEDTQETQKDYSRFVFPTSEIVRYKFPTNIDDLVMDRSEARFSEAFIVVIEPEKAPPLHRHNDTEQIFYVLEGEGVLTIGQESPRKMPVVPRDLVRIPVGDWHSIKAGPEDTLKYLAINCFGSIRNPGEPTWDSHVRVLCREQGWEYDSVVE